MSEPGTRGAAQDFTELWRKVSLLSDDAHERTSGTRHAAGASAATMCTDLRSPQHRGCSRSGGWTNGDSPGDVEPSQDIFWDPTSPTSAAAALRNSRFVEISDIVNRIAPKDVKRKAAESPLLQWIGDSAVPFTQGVPKPRARKRFSRPSGVDDLLKLARQFDENMQQDRETSERLGAAAPEPEPGPPAARRPGDLKCPPSSDPAEAELRALFDCSTQRVSGRLSQASSASARSQEVKRQPTAGGSGPAGGNGSCGFKADDFDDDWDDDDLLDDPFVLAMTRDPALQRGAHHAAAMQGNTETDSGAFASVCETAAHPAPKPSALQELCPKPKTSNRSTFKLQPNPHFRTARASPGAAAAQLKPTPSDQKPAAAKTPSIPVPNKTETETRTETRTETKTETKTESCVAAVSSDSLWDDGVEDALLYQACDRVERTSSSQPGGCREKPTPPPPARSGNAAAGAANRQSPCAFARSVSLPGGGGGGGGAGSYQGWGVPMKGGDSKALTSRSLAGRRLSLGSFNRCGDAAADLRADVDLKPHASHQSAFKRGVADSAAGSSKVFVTSQTSLKCSAAEIGRKKQDALARRRLRLQNAKNP